MAMFELLLVVILGAVVGAAYFGGLWYTALRLSQSRHPGCLIVVSFCMRLGLLGVALYVMAAQGWQSLVAVLLGILLARGIFVRVARAPQATGP